MFNLPSIRLGRFFGIPVEVNLTWFVVFLLVAASFSFAQFPLEFRGLPLWVSVVAGLVTTVLFFTSVVLHEMSHSLVARRGGLKISKITLFIFGGVAQMEEEPERAGLELRMAIAGPGMSILLAVLFFGLFLVLAGLGASRVLVIPVLYLAQINLSLGVFNLLPGFPLDGGRVFRALAWWRTGDVLKATRWATRAGQFIGLLMIGGGILGVLFAQYDLVWFVLLGWFLVSLAGASYQQQLAKSTLSSLKVSDVMSSPAVVAPGGITVQQMVEDHFLGGRHSRYPVVEDGKLLGLVSLNDVKALPREEWPHVTVSELADRDLPDVVVGANEPLDTVIPMVSTDRPGAALVVEGGELVGIVTRADVLSALQSLPRK